MLGDKDRFMSKMMKPTGAKIAVGTNTDDFKVMYVSFKGRPFKCNIKKAGKDDPMSCMAPNSGPDKKASSWTMVRGVICKEQPEFKTAYPDCLYRTKATFVASKSSTDVTQNAQLKKMVNMDAPLGLLEDTTPKEADPAKKKFKPSTKKFPVFVDETGDLCTNMKTMKSFEMLAFV